MVKLILIRHGQTEWNTTGKFQGWTDVFLSETGKKQIKKLAENFPVDHIDLLYSSDLKRAVDTAKTFSDYFGCKIQLEPAFREVCFGDWEGLTYREINEEWSHECSMFYTSPDCLKIPNGETFSEVQERAFGKIENIVSMHNDKTIVVISHGAVIRTVIAKILHMPLNFLWSIRQDNASFNTIIYADGHFVLQDMNNTSHL